MTFNEFKYKLKQKAWFNIIKFARNKPVYPLIYKSYWHEKIFKRFNEKSEHINYYSAVPNRGAGIGHQMANWIAGFWFSKQFGLRFAHIPFSTSRWETFLGFGNGEITVKELIEKHDYQKVLLPLFDENKPSEINLIKNIIKSYNGKKIVFIAEQDQPYMQQFGVIKELKSKFYNNEYRKKDKLIYSKDSYNIAIHVRRGDIVVGQTTKNPNLLMRWQNNDYFSKVLTNVLNKLETDKPIYIYLFSQGKLEDFPDFKAFENINFCLEMNAQESFLHMVFADILITSKSSFSYKPALLSNGIKVCPKHFWHDYPNTEDWVLVNENGELTNDFH